MKVGIKVLGCPKNEADCEILAGLLKERGHEIVHNVEEADVVVLDTCAFIEDAKKESIDEILSFVEAKEDYGYRLVVKGCLVQRYYRELKKEIPEVDQWIGVVAPEKIVSLLENGEDLVPQRPETVYSYRKRINLEEKPYAYVKISDGCDRKCTFCSIPSFKGNLKSRSVEDIVHEVEDLLAEGKKEIILVAQDTTSYGEDLYGKQALSDLLRRLNSLKGDFWIRVMYLHPDHLTDEIIDTILKLEKVVNYFDVPVQHGSDRILTLMGRIRSSKELKNMLLRIRDKAPDAVLRTSVIVGFPGETEEDFEELKRFVEEVKFDKLGVFVYSDEEGTVASSLKNKVDPETARRRQEELLLLQAEISYERLDRFVGKSMKALVEGRENGYLIGRTFTEAPEVDGVVFIKGRGEMGDFLEVTIEEHDEYDMWGIAR
ncbi:30S ribosomal protein S12 methylthiotransferase RimO [Thermotoga neapolitana]|uniref:Ribosomal protein uS12 methylthiotransferase RimO n=1 Tax=Thermotoga neapolitana (strain ATCC 49049 / DSM 4359 / NBRC 107923 / NS-E) TaxID=309803 RepID=B9K7P0_THENN|nr:30S ribosomal protein S12 methylthiotransferase RimO [Thermotoga neapolitana]ACM22973.1 MiaB-like tRNA modifying enzyme YliG [Thermotoga neapolitana DSM 4359]KFZ21794.1 MiaB-like tRNA modifying enzyme YliG [Thermotoga neapolitana LA10]MDK2950088.1 ribosomal protein methylthiotransferase [Thermotoga sp.]HBF10403.1 30S ribosomal protein S12 methylthiotransferase RimO [Thermotoga neapolitana]